MEKLIKIDTPAQFLSQIILIRQCRTCGAQYVITKGQHPEHIYCMLPKGDLLLVGVGKHRFKCPCCDGIREI